VPEPAGALTFSRRSLHGQIAAEIGEQIMHGRLAPGDVLPNEEDWSRRLGISRTALREAIKVLAGKGLIESRPKTGTRVRAREFWNILDPDILAWRLTVRRGGDYAHELFELRRVIEPAACTLAAERATADQLARLDRACDGMELAGDDGELFAAPDLLFHQTILRMTGNELIASLAALIEAALSMSFRLSNANPAGQRHSVPLHRAVALAIRARDGGRACKAMIVLLDGSEEDVRRAMAARPAAVAAARPAMLRHRK
jgi:DNA-binding FadR family transcriptional regulator